MICQVGKILRPGNSFTLSEMKGRGDGGRDPRGSREQVVKMAVFYRKEKLRGGR